MEVREIDAASLTDRDVDAYVSARRAVQQRDDPLAPAEGREYLVGQPLPEEGERRRIWWATEHGSVLGYVGVAFPTTANLERAQLILEVVPAVRGRGIGRALLRSVAIASLTANRSQLWLALGDVAPGPAVARHYGFVVNQELIRSVQRREDAPEPPGLPPTYREIVWSGPCPEDLLDAYGAAKDAMADAPQGVATWQFTPKTPARIRAFEAARTAHGQVVHVLLLFDGAGEVAAFTEAYVADLPRGWVGDTAVLPEHRGRRLGFAAKSRLQRRLPAHVTELQTYNAAENTHMLRVNTALGYREERRILHLNASTADVHSRLG